ncbi:MAG: metallophosphatase family protein [Alphaproteobacteria bacterium]|nr:metallophosphatase family protein [Alphaproteobacteria bacterium]
MTTIGVISDTHGLLRPEAVRLLAGVDLILHAGDIGSPDVISALNAIAPVTAVRGNNDRDGWAASYPEDAVLEVGGRTLYMLHDLKELNLDPRAAGFDAVVAGHSHKPKVETVDGVLYLNPGSAGPRRFTLPIALAMLDIADGDLHPRIHEIEL